MSVVRRTPDPARFNPNIALPFELRLDDFRLAMQDVYDFLFDVNQALVSRGLERLDDMLRPANMSGMVSDMLTASLAKHSRSLVVNAHHNGHPDLLVKGMYPNNATKSGEAGVEIKSTLKRGGAVDTHGGRDQWMCVFVYAIDNKTEPAIERAAMVFREVYLGQVGVEDFRRNERSDLGTRTSTLHAEGIARLRKSWVYLDQEAPVGKAASRGKASAARSK
jgi:hypothetical protein